MAARDVRHTPLFAAACLLAGIASVMQSAAAAEVVFKGSATYTERLMMPPDAVFEATLEDVSNPSAPLVMGRTRVDAPGQPPIRFKIKYDSSRVAASGRYVVRAQITHRERLLFIGDSQNGASLEQAENMQIVLQRATGRSTPLTPAKPSAAPPSASAPPAQVARPTPAPAPAPAPKPAAAAPAPVVSPLGTLPATFMGVFPCADCLELSYHLNVLGEGRYELRMTYVGKPRDRVDTWGRWTLREKGALLELKDRKGEWSEEFDVINSSKLRKLDLSGKPLPSGFSYDMERQPTFVPLEGASLAP